MPLGGYKGAGRTDRVVAESSKKHVSFKSGFESRERFAANRKHTTFQHQHNKIQTTRNFQETFEDVIALQSFFPRISYRTCAVTDVRHYNRSLLHTYLHNHTNRTHTKYYYCFVYDLVKYDLKRAQNFRYTKLCADHNIYVVTKRQASCHVTS